MPLSLTDIEGANFDALPQAGTQLGTHVDTLRQQLDTGRQVVADLRAGWEGQASVAAVTAAERTLQQEQKLVTGVQRVQSVLSEGARLSATRTSILQGADQLRQQGWQVAQDGTVSIQPGGPLERLAQDSPVSEMQLRQLAATRSVELKKLMADLDTGDRQLAQQLRDALQDLDGDSDRQGDDTKPDDTKPDEKTSDEPDEPPASATDPVQVAEDYLGRNAAELMAAGELGMDPNCPPDKCCANFVTGVLQRAGLIDWHSINVGETSTRLQQQGWKPVPASEAKPGDVAIINGTQHVELVRTNENGTITLIGSNNVNADGTQQVSTDSYTPTSGDQVVYLSPP